MIGDFVYFGNDVSTHSRLKAAGSGIAQRFLQGGVSTHSRLKAAGLTHFEFAVIIVPRSTRAATSLPVTRLGRTE